MYLQGYARTSRPVLSVAKGDTEGMFCDTGAAERGPCRAKGDTTGQFGYTAGTIRRAPGIQGNTAASPTA